MNRQKTSSCKVVVPVVSRELTSADILARWKLRWGIGRKKTDISPGLYRGGSPDSSSPVLVTANYRLSFDALRTSMPDRSFWVLVLDTRGVNVWCAAGKGTFGTEELIERINSTEIAQVVAHRTLILPQLGAPGIVAHEVRKKTGFKVVYGPVRSKDIGAFIDNDLKTDENMRTVRFTLRDRAVLTPIELVQSVKLLLFVLPYVFLFHLLQNRGITPALSWEALIYFGSILAGTVLAPLLLPWIPGRALALKGWIVGVTYTAAVVWFFPLEPLGIAAYFLLLPAISSFLFMNFTGSTTYTSLSGVVKEMSFAVPALIISAAAGTVLQILRIFI